VRNLLIGAALGLLLGVTAAFVREALDVRVRDVDVIEEGHQVPVLAVVPNQDARERVPALSKPESARVEAYRKVRTHLLFAAAEGMPRVLVVTSPNEAEGKTSLAINLAVVSAQAGQRVIVVDGDLRRPMVAQTLLGTSQAPGVVDLLRGSSALGDVIRRHDSGVDVVPAGRPPADPSALAASPELAGLIAGLAQRYDLVIVDAPPVLPVADALHLASVSAGVVLSSRAGATTETELRRARESLERARATVLGIVLIGSRGADDSYGYGYGASGYYSYTSRRAGE
jgi:receptor protein-tyrosine kinase